MAESIDIRELNERIERQSAFVTNLTTGMDQIIVGQKHLVESLLIGLLSDGHVLLEGVPGLAKTLAIKTLASLIDAKYSRIQFTPDLLPADVIGTMVYSQKDESFKVQRGPIFANFVLADEINRAPAKVQSALLEAMQPAPVGRLQARLEHRLPDVRLPAALPPGPLCGRAARRQPAGETPGRQYRGAADRSGRRSAGHDRHRRHQGRCQPGNHHLRHQQPTFKRI